MNRGIPRGIVSSPGARLRAGPPAGLVLELQRTIGNRAVQQLLVDGRSALMERQGHASAAANPVLVQRQPAPGSGSEGLLQKLLEQALREGAAYNAKDGVTVGGAP